MSMSVSVNIQAYQPGSKAPGRARHIMLGLLCLGLLFIAVGVPTNNMLHVNVSNGAVYGYFQNCDSNSVNPTCHSLVKDYWNCAVNQSPNYAYSTAFLYTSNGGVDQTACIQQISAEVSGLLSGLCSLFAVIAAVFSIPNRVSPNTCAILAIFSVAFGMGALIVYMTIVPTALNTQVGLTGYSWTDYVNAGMYKLDYSFALQVIGIFFTFVGALLAICAKRIEETIVAV